MPGRTAPRSHRVARLPLSSRLSLSAVELLHQARRALAEAEQQAFPGDRYAGAHLAALRGAAAVLASKPTPMDSPARRRPTSAWVLITELAPELSEWAAYFASGARKRAAAEAGAPNAVSERDAADLVRDVGTFLAVVETSLGVIETPRAPVLSA